jgi:hypothetical protein
MYETITVIAENHIGVVTDAAPTDYRQKFLLVTDENQSPPS